MRWPDARGDERGSAATLVMPFVGVLLLVMLALAFQGGVLVAQRRAQAAADLAALAGAVAAQHGDADPCSAAATMAARNAAHLASCRLDGAGGREVIVDVEREGPALWGRSMTARASARAGPDPP